ncbi:Uncharacterised protein [Actinomyces howellii]|uniref:PKD domain-containing protein n=1 Tax=Actinomyces howellii TaxID=52771 RepID=A0A448HKG3_9ACTO|nr:Uncharacterised protein [Actinomyces howellii]
MKRARIAAAVLLLVLANVLPAGRAYSNDKEGATGTVMAEGSDASITLTGRSSTESSAPSSGAGPSGGQVYRDGGTVCGGGTLVQMPYTDANGQETTGWKCMKTAVTPSEADSVVVTATDVSRLMVEGSGLWRQPPGPEARVDIIVIAYTSPDSRTLSTTVAGVPVTVTATPVSYRFHWGDGTATTTTDQGAPYPNHTVYHDYTGTRSNVVITVTTTWEATFTPEGGTSQPVTGTITTTSSADPFDLVRTVTYLTDDAEEAQGH